MRPQGCGERPISAPEDLDSTRLMASRWRRTHDLGDGQAAQQQTSGCAPTELATVLRSRARSVSDATDLSLSPRPLHRLDQVCGRLEQARRRHECRTD